MAFRESKRTRRRKKKAARKARERGTSSRFKGGVVRSKASPSKRNRKKTTAIAKVMLATEFGKKQGGIQKLGAAIVENRFSNEEEASRTWNDLLDPFNINSGPLGTPPVHPPKPPTKPPTGFGGFEPRRPEAQRGTFKGKGASAVRPKATAPATAGAVKIAALFGTAISLAASGSAIWWLGQAMKGGNDTSTQLMVGLLEEVSYAIYINNRLISVLDDQSFEQFMGNMKRNLQLRTRGLRSD